MVTKVYALWFGGSGYVRSSVDEHLEIFDTVNLAREAFRNRHDVGSRIRQDFTYADGRTESTFTPTVDETSEMWLYFYDPRGEHDFQRARFTGTVTCQRCGLLPMDDDDRDAPCVPVDDPYPNRRLTFGPRGGVRTEDC